MLTPRADDKNRDKELLRKSENPGAFGAAIEHDINEKLREQQANHAAARKNAEALSDALDKKEAESKKAARRSSRS